MPSRSDLEIKSRLFLGLGLLSLVVLLLRLLLPVFVIAALGAGGYWLWRQWKQQQQQQQRRQARLDAKFYQLLRQQQGHISVLDFAMFAQINGAAAQSYLNAQAQAFLAHFETTVRGDIIYVFNLATMPGPSSHRFTPAETAWAYAEQAHSARMRAKKAQTAWANAKQIRTLSQLSKQEMKADHASKERQSSHQSAGRSANGSGNRSGNRSASLPIHKALATRKLASHRLVRLPHEGISAPDSVPPLKSAQGKAQPDDWAVSPTIEPGASEPVTTPIITPIITIEVPAVRG
jgi:hypothetical protein